MSIDRDTFKNTSEDELADLPSRSGTGVSRRQRGSGVQGARNRVPDRRRRGAVSTASRLKDRDLVEHKATYWAITDDAERLDGYSGYERATALFNNQLGTEDKEAWREYALRNHTRVSEDEQ